MINDEILCKKKINKIVKSESIKTYYATKKNITTHLVKAYKGYVRSCNIKRLYSRDPTIYLYDTRSCVKNKFWTLLEEMTFQWL